MKMLMMFFLTLLGCSQINTESRDHYQEQKQMRHGVVPIPVSVHKTFKTNPPNEEQIASGKEIYMKNCYSCHGIDAKGTGPAIVDLKVKPKNLIKLIEEVPNFKFYMTVSQWQGKMPGWINVLSEQELDDVKAYIKHLALNQKTNSRN